MAAADNSSTQNAAYNQPLPRGYTYMQVGTPDLAERCKEISRQKGFTVRLINVRIGIQ